MSAPILSDRVVRLSGFGNSGFVDGYLFRPTSVSEVREALRIAKESGRKVVLRGAGRSYGDAAIASEAIVIDISRMNRVLDWDPVRGVMDCEAGVTIEGLWRTALEDGWWPPVVSGTMSPTLGGALAMNIHGKNNFRAGTLGEHVLDLHVLWPNGTEEDLEPNDPRFYAVISGAGLIGIITRAKLQLKHVQSGGLSVLAVSPKQWSEQFETFERYEESADYMVSWVDCFARGRAAGRGQIHVAWYLHPTIPDRRSMWPDRQDLPDTIMGLVPKSVMWRFLKPLTNRAGMRFVNWAKDRASRTLGDGKRYDQSLVAFSFLLDYVPNWRNAYLPSGFLQYQSFVPKEHAKEVFERQIKMQQEAKLESYLGVMKRHRPDRFLFTHAVDGYSLALDFKIPKRRPERLIDLCHRMNDVVLQAGGRFYLAKDSTLRPSDARAYLGDAVETFRKLKGESDPEALLTSALAERLKLIG